MIQNQFLQSVLRSTACVLLFGTAHASAQQNIALNKTYTWSVAPSYPLSTDPGDATQLTNGQTSNTTGSFHTNPEALGWIGRSSDVVSLTVDLGQSELIGGLSFSSAGGFSNIGLPALIDTWVSDDGVNFHYGGELITGSAANGLPDGGDLRGQPYTFRHVYQTNDLRLQGRYVKFTAHRAGAFMFTDEVQVFRGDFSPQQVVQSPIQLSSGFEDWTRQNKRGAIAGIRALYDLQEVAKHTQANAFSSQIQSLQQQIQNADRLASFDPTAGLPYNSLNEQVWQLNGQMNKAAGQDDHAIEIASRYDPLHPFDTVVNDTNAQNLHLMGGERRAAAINLSNNTQNAKYAIVELQWEGGTPPTGSLDLRTVRFTESQEHTIVGSALVKAEPLSNTQWRVELPAGATSQLWLTVDAAELDHGNYDLQVNVTPDGGQTMAVPIGVNVHRGRIDDRMPEMFGWDYLSPKDGTQPSSDLNRAQLQQTLKSYGMRSHWINPSPLAFDARFAVRNLDGTYAEEPDFSNFEQWLDQLESHPEGTDKYYAFLATDIVGEKFYTGNIETTDPRYETALASFFHELAERVDARGLDREKFVFMPLDEPVGATGTHPEAVRFVQVMKQAVPEFKAAITPVYKSVAEVDQDLLAEMDVIIANLPKIADNPQLLNYYKQLTRDEGKSLATYVATDGGQLRSPANYFRRLGWEAERLGLDATAVWVAVRADIENSFDDFSGNGRFELLFAQVDSGEVVPSKMLAAMHEGAQDYARFRAIDQTADQVRDAGMTRALGWWAKREAQRQVEAVFNQIPSHQSTTWQRDSADNDAFDRLQLLTALDAVDRFTPKQTLLLADDFEHGSSLDLNRWSRWQPHVGGAENVTNVDLATGVLHTRRGEFVVSHDGFDLTTGEVTLTSKMLGHAVGDAQVARIYNADQSQYLEMVYQAGSDDRVQLQRVAGGVVQEVLADMTLPHNLAATPSWMAMNISDDRVELSLLPHNQTTFADFEGPSYIAGQTLAGQDGWQFLGSGAFGQITPDPSSGYNSSLEGDRSLVLNGVASREFDSATTITDGTVISWRMRLDPGASAAVYLSEDLGAGSTPAGIEFTGGKINAFSNTTDASNTGLFYEDATEYVVSMEVNFTADAFTFWIESIDGRLSDAPQSYAFLKEISVDDVLQNGGLFLSSDGYTLFDDIQIVSPLDQTSPAVLVYSGEHGLEGDLTDIHVALGNQLTGVGAESRWDDVSITLQESFATIPEPGSMMLLSFGGVLMLVRHRRCRLRSR